jgi:holo-[acyl-carrier protein] synthase
MIRGIGIDIESIARFHAAEEGLLDRILSPEDKEYVGKFADPAPHVAGFWAAKEALVKALGRKDIVFRSISVRHEATGKPYFSYTPDEGSLHLSITHGAGQAVAVVVWEA